MPPSGEPARRKAVGFTLLWLAAAVFFVVLLTDYEFELGGNRRLSESASDYLAVAGAAFSAWAVAAWVRRLLSDPRA